MKTNISFSADSHANLVLLLPWYVNNTLEASEHQQVEQHLRSCLVCRRELIALRKLAAEVKQATDLDVAAEASFAGLQGRLQKKSALPVNAVVAFKTQSDLSKNTDNKRQYLSFSGHGFKGWAIAASVLLATTLPLLMKHQQQDASVASYYTLSAAKPEASHHNQVRVVFAKHLAEKDIDALLKKVNAIKVDGPNSVGAYTLGFTQADPKNNPTDNVALLRSQQDVILAEPVLTP